MELDSDAAFTQFLRTRDPVAVQRERVGNVEPKLEKRLLIDDLNMTIAKYVALGVDCVPLEALTKLAERHHFMPGRRVRVHNPVLLVGTREASGVVVRHPAGERHSPELVWVKLDNSPTLFPQGFGPDHLAIEE